MKVLITGASEGIGLELAKCFARDGASLYLAARNEEKLRKAESLLRALTAGTVTVIPIDLSVQDGAQKLYERVKGEEIDVLVNNAGTGYTGPVLMQDIEDMKRMILLNDMTPVILSSLFLKDMKERGSGIILNVCSTGAFQPGPYIAEYYASKSFLLSWTRAVQEEMKGSGVHLCALCPGPTDTAFYDKTGGVKPANASSAEQCARYAYRHMKTKTVLYPKMTDRLLNLVPSGIRMKAVKRMKKKDTGISFVHSFSEKKI